MDLQVAGGVMLAAAFLPPTPRVLGFTTGVVCMVGVHFRTVMNINLAVQLAMYGIGAYVFLRCAPLSPHLALPIVLAARFRLLHL